MKNIRSRNTKILLAAICVIVAAAMVIAAAAIVKAFKKSAAASGAADVCDVVLSAGNTDNSEYHHISRQIAEKTAQQIVSLGMSAVVSDSGRADKSGNIYIEIACDYDDENAFSSGISALYQKGAKQLANALLSSVAESAAVNSRGAKKGNSGSEANPYCKMTVGFLSNGRERGLLESADYQIKLAEGIANGIKSYLDAQAQSARQGSDMQSQSSVQADDNSQADVPAGGQPDESQDKSSKKKTMYLTFDDGPHPTYTEKILKILKKNNVKATFFLIGGNAEKHPEIVKKIAADGHTIGIHCYNHDYNKIYKSTNAYIADFAKAQKAVEKIIGTAPVIFRFPGGSVNSYNKKTRKDIIRTMLKNGYVYFDWNAMFGDAGNTTTVSGVISYAINTVSDSKKEIVMLAHDAGAKGNTYKALQKVIDHYKRDYNFKALQYDTTPIRF